jgi:ketosteroid isomerase-like protein
MKKIALFFCFGIILIGCTSTPKVDTVAEAEAIRNLEEQWAVALQANDLDKIMSTYAHDAVSMSTYQPICNGTQAIHESYKSQFADTTILWNSCSLTIEIVEVSASGDLAYSRSTESLSQKKAEGHVENIIKRVNIWKKIAGEWKCIINIWTHEKPQQEQ